MKNRTTTLPVEKIRATCEEQGLAIDDVRQKGTVLVLEPRQGTSIPQPRELAALAEAIEVEGIRYVTLGLDGFAGEANSDD